MKLITVLLTVLCGALVPAHPAHATDDFEFCTLDFEVTISPGLVPAPTTATYTTGGDTGTITCRGVGPERQVTRVGRMAASGVAGLFGGATCDVGIGGGTLSFALPTADGQTRMTSDYAFSWAGPAGDLTGNTMSGSFELTAVVGDCLTAPVTRARVHSLGVLHI